tara:strand:+ start:945 stop:3803 length:2859 start_codon:yes stop_codon:yes gene_type:complete
MTDVLFINPASSKEVYQNLSEEYSAIGTPYWALLLAESCRSKGYKVKIIDVLAEKLDDDTFVKRVFDIGPKLVVFCVYGENVNGGTAYMEGAVRLSKLLKKSRFIHPHAPISFVGSYIQALPDKVLVDEDSIDIVFTSEGVYSLWEILKLSRGEIWNINELQKIKGIGYRKNHNTNELPILTEPQQIVPQERMDIDLPGYAWDLLPYKEKPFDLYRSPMWHAEYDSEKRTPYASLYTSLGCVFQCEFCMINIINRDDNDEIGVAGNYNKMRFWSTEFVLKQFDKLVEMGVKTIRIIDEMFLLNPKYYIPLCEGLIERGYGSKLRMWAYSRVDTIKKPEVLGLLRKAGFKWLALGIESSQKSIRLEVSKGKFEDVDIKDVVKKVEDANINVMANYMFGLPGDTLETMNETLEFSKELNTAGWNGYPAMALPGSQLYKDSSDYLIGKKDYRSYSFHSYETKPMGSKELSLTEVIRFRDFAWKDYHTNKLFLDKVENKLGKVARSNIEEMSKVELKRKYNKLPTRNQVLDIITQYGGFWNSAPDRYPSPIFVYYEYNGGYPKINDWIGEATPGVNHPFHIEKIDAEYYIDSEIKYPLILNHHGEILERCTVNNLLRDLEDVGVNINKVKILDSNVAKNLHPNVVGVDSEFYQIEFLVRKKYLFGDKIPYTDEYFKFLEEHRKPKTYMALCSTLHIHRKFSLNEIFRRNILDMGYVSAYFGNKDEIDGHNNIKSVEEMNNEYNDENNPDWWYPHSFVFEEWKKLPIVLDMVQHMNPTGKFTEMSDSTARFVNLKEFDESEIKASLDGVWPILEDKKAIPHKYFENSYFSFIMDSVLGSTLDNSSEFKFITEKVYRTILLHPMILLGCAYTLKHLRGRGFETFPELFDESYDEIEDDYLRFMFIMDEIERVCNLPKEELHEKYVSVLPKIKHNQEIFYNSKEQIHKEMDKIIKEVVS